MGLHLAWEHAVQRGSPRTPCNSLASVAPAQLSPCVMEGVPQPNASFWGAVLPYVCPTAVPLNCSCTALDPNCLNALYWLGHKCAKFQSPSAGFRRTDSWW